MSLTDFLYVLILAGSIQGIITGFLLFRVHTQRVSSRLLAVIMWLIALPGVHLFAHHALLFNNTVVADWIHALIPWVLMMALGPLLYFYMRSLAVKNFTLQKKETWHLVPAAIDILPKLTEVLFLAGLLPAVLMPDKAALIRFIDIYNRYADLPRWISLAYYVYLCYGMIKQWQTNIVTTNGHEKVLAAWAFRFIYIMRGFMIIWGCYLVPYLVPATSAALNNTVGWFPVYMPLAVLIYWIGITGYRQIITSNNVSAVTVSTDSPADAGYSKELLEQTARLLVAGMETGRLFLNPQLDVAALSKAIGVPAKLISATLNQHLDRSFSQFINEYRVAAFKERIAMPGASELTMAGLAISCGFSSAATFQRVFKQMTGVTPTEFKKTAVPAAESL